MSWQPCLLGDVITLKRGHDLPESQRLYGAVPVVSSSGITGYHNEPKAKAPGVVTGRYGTLGEVFYLEQDFWPLNTALYVVDFKGSHPRYVAYLLKYLLRNQQSDKAAVPGVNRNVLHTLKMLSPDRKTQERIADLLSQYDDLIENNRRRIQLLEESTRLLYREWFIHLRFPGHKHVNIVDGVPKGWRRTRLGDKIILNYGKALKEEEREEGLYPVYGSSGVVGSHDKSFVSGPGIVIGRKGNVGSVYWSFEDYWPIDTVYFISREQSNFYLYYALQYMTFISNDAAVPGLNRDFAYSRPYLHPSKILFQQFEEYSAVVYRQIRTLQEQSRLLKEARDLLLPRLMNGEIKA